jgi:hypothetical protein
VIAPRLLVAGSAVASTALVAIYLAAGGGSYTPTPVADPCEPRERGVAEGIEESAQQFLLSALDGAACELGVSRETLAAALATEESRQEFAAEQGIDDAVLEEAVRAGVIRAIDDAEAADELNPVIADGLRALAARLPVDEAVSLIAGAQSVFEDAGGVIDDIGGVIDQLEGLIP